MHAQTRALIATSCGTSGRSGAEAEASRGGAEAGGLQGEAERRGERRLAVGLLDGQLAERTITYGESQGVDCRGEAAVVVAEGQQRPSAALDVEDERAVDEHD